MTFYETQLWKIRKAFPSDEVCDRIGKAVKFMDENYGSGITLDQLASEACMSKFHFVRVFRKLHGRTPYQYLTSTRMRQAASALRANLTVTHACYDAGFDSTTTFASRFRKSVGVAPSQYARRWSK
ncbi:MAG TPA: AraC family transcriptional regulator [Cyclobacteriaceae bacterium]|nr:AraC family transcriptional regulator [Cyclobacteriaceae bacterium]